ILPVRHNQYYSTRPLHGSDQVRRWLHQYGNSHYHHPRHQLYAYPAHDSTDHTDHTTDSPPKAADYLAADTNSNPNSATLHCSGFHHR
ncbi:MAG: hypothetical protein LH606_05135, partial [Cytophagaceae bacterium]|nr:hypothetical protein [Cytophagaceae bacterium]